MAQGAGSGQPAGEEVVRPEILAAPSATKSAIFAVLPLAESYSTRPCPPQLAPRYFQEGVSAGLFIALDRLGAAAEVLGQERLGRGLEFQPVLRSGEAVTLVGK